MEPPHIVLLCEWGLQETVHSSRVSSANLECRQLNDPIFSQQPGKEGTLVFLGFFFSRAAYLPHGRRGPLGFLPAPTGEGDGKSSRGGLRRSGVGRR